MSTATAKQRTAMRELFGMPLSNKLFRALDLMEIAGEEIERAYPFATSARVETRELWQATCPTDFFRTVVDDVYRAHVRELIARAKKHEQTKSRYALRGVLAEPTDAEVMIGFSSASQVAPLNRRGALAYRELFVRVFVHRPDLRKELPNEREQYVGEKYEAIEEARAALRGKVGR